MCVYIVYSQAYMITLNQVELETLVHVVGTSVNYGPPLPPFLRAH